MEHISFAVSRCAGLCAGMGLCFCLFNAVPTLADDEDSPPPPRGGRTVTITEHWNDERRQELDDCVNEYARLRQIWDSISVNQRNGEVDAQTAGWQREPLRPALDGVEERMETLYRMRKQFEDSRADSTERAGPPADPFPVPNAEQLGRSTDPNVRRILGNLDGGARELGERVQAYKDALKRLKDALVVEGRDTWTAQQAMDQAARIEELERDVVQKQDELISALAGAATDEEKDLARRIREKIAERERIMEEAEALSGPIAEEYRKMREYERRISQLLQAMAETGKTDFALLPFMKMGHSMVVSFLNELEAQRGAHMADATRATTQQRDLERQLADSVRQRGLNNLNGLLDEGKQFNYVPNEDDFNFDEHEDMLDRATLDRYIDQLHQQRRATGYRPPADDSDESKSSEQGGKQPGGKNSSGSGLPEPADGKGKTRTKGGGKAPEMDGFGT